MENEEQQKLENVEEKLEIENKQSPEKLINIEEKKEDDKSEEQTEMEQISYILKKPEILRMHLEILYKSVSFVSQIKINEGLFEFKARKEKILLEQQIRNNEQKIKRKQRSTNKKEEEFDQDVDMKNENAMNSK